MELAKPFIRLPFRFDASVLSHELAAFSESDWMPHPSGIAGNSAIPLVSQGGNANNHFVGEMLPTTYLNQCPYALQVMASFNEVIARSRFMRLSAGAEVSAHVDFNYHWYSRVRIHIPVVTNPNVIFYCGDETRHMAAGECWIFDSWRWHNVVNKGTEDRIHLVIDLAGSAKFWALVEQCELVDDLTSCEPDSRVLTINFRDGYQPDLVTERYNVVPVMAPGEMQAIAKELVQDFSAHPSNPPEGVTLYKRLLLDLVHDWRALWLQYGHEKTGWPFYRALLDKTASRLHANPRFLITHSNEVGVNPIIMQRILRAALNADQVNRFAADRRDSMG